MYLPTAFYMLTLGHLVYSIGEYREQSNRIPHILMLLMFKILLIGFVIYSIYSWHFKNEHHSFAMLLWGFLIMFDSKYLNNILANIDNYEGDSKEFKPYLIDKIRQNLEINGSISWFIWVKIIMTLLLALIIICYCTYDNGITISDICLPIYVYYDIRLFNYYLKFIN